MSRDNRRRRYWINLTFQRRFLLRILLLELVVVVVTAIVSLGVALVLVNPAFQVGPGWGGS